MPKSLRTPRQRQLQSLLTAARKKNGMTQADLATALDKPQSFVAKYENGERRIDVVEFIDIATAVGAVPGEILAQIQSVDESAKRTGRRPRKA
ncbi:helix-turn-helix domain-containing protein [Rhodopseudomonas palustris]|uniref:Helix-turn-helix transcriptional regulator n=1 Tax=Rhodopseudomonas palustris (strain ATCC BAA-98 / CGA009) TaxID=258594 RepID=Q6N2B6_RHOPA|nr:helix-turn-helix transcriptional regulator [Rhodopseudomonas palustris]OPF92466.1 transcriptional regulator [Rhodopseudomonas palustris]RJF63921.1 XRE family transcriptional regulator [Rhodopseudomonas palustris]WAB77025.1 helix-turn-helix transcriptional regulator [Rhodopseudomonas palustris]WCL94322.1 helix-turn-helix transcriptional regulator [Rhodopseudomonas palustris CGA009]WND50937.1 helix-turn-helix domain-containing protein [Rhodopseudomonas palustris]